MKEEHHYLSQEIFEKRTKAGLSWLKRSIDVCGGDGSSAYFSRTYKPIKGWAAAYPETTGYIIETLFDYSLLYNDESLRQSAIKQTDWICTLQFESGALPGGLIDNIPAPSIFNTGQMIFGLVRAFEETQDEKYRKVFTRAAKWLVEVLEDDGSWSIGAYVKGFVPSYYTRVVWSVLLANKYMNDAGIRSSMIKAIQYYAGKIQKNQSVTDWSFKEGQKAFTHTIAYTIRGFLESALLLEDQDLLDKTRNLAKKIMQMRELKGSMAGWYDSQWNGSYKFTCLTGNSQLSIILSKLYKIDNDIRYHNASLQIFGDVVDKQKLSGGKNKYGALSGSSPIWGRYLFMRYPNWAVKFYLEAYLLLHENHQSLKSKG